MHIMIVTSSPRGNQSQTLRLVSALARGVREAGAHVDVVDLSKLKMEYCNACDACHRTGTCMHHDDIVSLRKKLFAADGIVLASPNYFRSVTAQMKTLIDRMSDVIHCQLFRGKYACSLSVSGGPACNEATDYLNQVLIGYGAWVVGSVSEAMMKGPAAMTAAEQKAADLGKSLVDAINTRKTYPEQQSQHASNATNFHNLVDMNKARWPHEAEHWAKKQN